MTNRIKSATGVQTRPWIASAEDECILRRAAEILERRLIVGDAYTSTDVVKRYCQIQISTDIDESFCCLFLTTQHCLIKFECLFRGTVDGAAVYPRVVVRRALELNAAAVIFTHNHPSGISEPSSSDYSVTKKLKAALALIDVRVLDHIVVGVGEVSSFAELGRL